MVKRYGIVGVTGGLGGCKNGCLSSCGMIEQVAGHYVLASDYDTLLEIADIRDAAITEACARLKQLEAERDENLTLDRACKQFGEERDSLLKDALRYRWLRAGGKNTGLYVADSGRHWQMVKDAQLDRRIDAAIDQARAK